MKKDFNVQDTNVKNMSASDKAYVKDLYQMYDNAIKDNTDFLMDDSRHSTDRACNRAITSINGAADIMKHMNEQYN